MPLISKMRPVGLLDSPGDLCARMEIAAPSSTCVVPMPAVAGGPKMPGKSGLEPAAFARGSTMSKIGPAPFAGTEHFKVDAGKRFVFKNTAAELLRIEN